MVVLRDFGCALRKSRKNGVFQSGGLFWRNILDRAGLTPLKLRKLYWMS